MLTVIANLWSSIQLHSCLMVVACEQNRLLMRFASFPLSLPAYSFLTTEKQWVALLCEVYPGHFRMCAEFLFFGFLASA